MTMDTSGIEGVREALQSAIESMAAPAGTGDVERIDAAFKQHGRFEAKRSRLVWVPDDRALIVNVETHEASVWDSVSDKRLGDQVVEVSVSVWGYWYRLVGGELGDKLGYGARLSVKHSFASGSRRVWVDSAPSDAARDAVSEQARELIEGLGLAWTHLAFHAQDLKRYHDVQRSLGEALRAVEEAGRRARVEDRPLQSRCAMA